MNTAPLVAVAEGRELEKLAGLLESGGVAVLRCPMLAMVDPEDPAPVDAFLNTLLDGGFDEVLFMTGEGVTRFYAHAARAGRDAALTAALARIRVSARGFKAVKALTGRGLALANVAEPPTSEGVIARWVANPPAGLRVGIIRAGDEPVTKLERHLAGVAASVSVISSYTYAPASDSAAVAALLDRVAAGEVRVLALTSIAQARALLAAAERRGMSPASVFGATRIASIGPALTAFLAERGLAVALQPESRHFLPAFSKTILESLKA